MGHLAENANNMGAVLGITGQQFQVLTEAMEIVGLTGDSLGRTFRILSSGADTAIANPLSRQADAFRKLGIDAQEFAHVLRSDPEKALDILNEKFKEFGGAGGIEGPFGVLLGRSGAQVLKFFKEEIEDLKKKVQELGAPSQETLTRLDAMDDHFNRVSVAVKNLKFAIADLISPVMNVLLTTIEKITAAMTSVISGTTSWGEALRKLFSDEDDKNTVIVPVSPRVDPNRTHTSARENFSHYNYGNIKATTNPTTWMEYDSPEAGVAAIEDWLRRSQKYHGTDTLAKIIERYSPASDNQGKDLIGDAVRRSGLKPGERLDMENTDQLHKVTAAILAQEGAPKTAFDALQNIGGRGDYNIPTTKEVPDIQSAALKKWTDEYLKGLDAQRKATDDQYKYYEQYYRDDAAKAAQVAQQKAQADLKYVDERKRIIGQLPEHIRKEYQDETGEAWKAATEVLKADQKVEDEKTKLAVQGANERLKADQDAERSALQHAQSRAKIEDQTARELAAAQLQIVNAHEAAQTKILEDVLATAGLRKQTEEKLQADLNLIVQKHAEERRKIEDKAEEEHARNAAAINKEIARTVSGGLVDMAWGRTTPGQAIASTAQDLEKRALDSILTKALDASGIGKMLDSIWEKSIGSLFGAGKDATQQTAATTLQTGATALQTSAVSLETGSVSLQTGSAALQLAAEQLQLSSTISGGGGTGGVSSLASGGSKLFGSATGGGAELGDIFASQGTVLGVTSESLGLGGGSAAGAGGLGGLMGGLGGVGLGAGLGGAVGGAIGGKTGSTIGSILGGIAGAALFFLEGGGIVPSAAGGWQVPNVGSGSILAQLHSNEMVLPSGISSFIQSAAAGGKSGAPVHFAYSPTINAPETPNMKQLLNRHGNDMLTWISSQFRSGALRVPA